MQYSDSILSTFTAGDGDNLAVQYWPVSKAVVQRGVVVIVHGLGEHAGRYERMAQRLTSWGFTVYGYDQCGHGESGGVRGCLPTTMRLIEDLQDVVESARRRMRPNEPLIVLGHSLGALVACCLVLLRSNVPIDALVLSAPPFEPVLNRTQRVMLRVLPRFAPNLTLRNGIVPEALSHDAEVVEAYRSDPLVHNRISGRLANFIAQSGPRILNRAPYWKLPTLLLYGSDDCVMRPRACRAFAKSAPDGVVTAHCFKDMFHEVFNELDPEPAFLALQTWLDKTFPPPAREQRQPSSATAAA